MSDKDKQKPEQQPVQRDEPKLPPSRVIKDNEMPKEDKIKRLDG